MTCQWRRAPNYITQPYKQTDLVLFHACVVGATTKAPRTSNAVEIEVEECWEWVERLPPVTPITKLPV